MPNRPVDDADLSVLARWAPEMASALASLATDIALVLDADGTIRNVALGNGEPVAADAEAWIGQPWADTVTAETRTKIQNLLSDVAERGVSRRREVNHPAGDGLSVPVAYTAVRLGSGGPVLAVGRDLRAIAAIQQRFLDAQQEMERHYWKRQQAESRYRLLFQVATDGVIVLDAASLRVMEANPAAASLLGPALDELIGGRLHDYFDERSRALLRDLFTVVRGGRRPLERVVRLAVGHELVSLSVTPFRGIDGELLLLRVRRAGLPPGGADPVSGREKRLVDAVVVTDSSGHIVSASREFLAMVGRQREEELQGALLSRWVGSPDRGFDAIMALVNRNGIARELRTLLQPEDGASFHVELAAALLTEGEQEGVGFTMHAVPGNEPAPGPSADGLAGAIGELLSRLGREPLPALMREGIGVLERQFITAAMELCADDVDDAARMLGVDRRNLELRLRRQQLAFTPGDEDAPSPRGGK